MMLPHLTNKQKEILLLFLKFRFLNRYHIQQFLTHKDKKTINLWLKALVKNEYLEKVEEKSINHFSTRPTIYRLGKNGIKFLRIQDRVSENFLKNLYREDERSHTFISCCFLIADICLDLKNNSKIHEIFSCITRSDYSWSDSPLHFLSSLHPHLCLRKQKGSTITWYILDIFSSSFASAQIRRRIHAYMRFLSDAQWPRSMGNTSPVVLFVCASKENMHYIKRYARNKIKKMELENTDIRCTLEEDVKEYGVSGEIWEAL